MLTPEDEQTITQLVHDAITPLTQTVDNLARNVNQLTHEVMSLKIEVGSLKDFVSRDAEGIEKEINRAVAPHIKAMHPGYTLKKFELKNVIIKHSNGTRTQLTEFDGAFILTNTEKAPRITYAHELDDPVRAQQRREASARPFPRKQTVIEDLTINNLAPQTHLVIVEAKHTVTRQRINNKYKTLWKIRILLDKAKYNGDNDPELTNITQNFKLGDINDVILYIGGPNWEADAITYLQDLATGKRTTLDVRPDDEDLDMSPEEIEKIVTYMVNKVGYIAPNGTRYYISDAHNKYSAEAAPIVAFEGGGRRRQTRSIPMFIMKQHVTAYRWT